MKLEVPDSLTLADGSTVEVKGITAKVIDGKLEQIVYTVERASGAWSDVSADEVRAEIDPADAQAPKQSSDLLELQQVA